MLRPYAVVAFLIVAACGRSEPPIEHRATCPAPDGQAVATVTQQSEVSFGATQFTEVRVHAPGAAVDSVRGAFATADERRVNLHAYWRGPASLSSSTRRR